MIFSVEIREKSYESHPDHELNLSLHYKCRFLIVCTYRDNEDTIILKWYRCNVICVKYSLAVKDINYRKTPISLLGKIQSTEIIEWYIRHSARGISIYNRTQFNTINDKREVEKVNTSIRNGKKKISRIWRFERIGRMFWYGVLSLKRRRERNQRGRAFVTAYKRKETPIFRVHIISGRCMKKKKHLWN